MSERQTLSPMGDMPQAVAMDRRWNGHEIIDSEWVRPGIVNNPRQSPFLLCDDRPSSAEAAASLLQLGRNVTVVLILFDLWGYLTSMEVL